jgi:phosphatidylserine/phosphatidylglycerophosphate/cardiolipin synthase-like enzyme
MAKFLRTTGISHYLEELIKSTNDKLILISPYLQLHQRIKDHLQNLNVQKKDIRIVYRENKLQVEESNWLENQIGIRTSVCSSLHAKCYINESEAIVTSMNLYTYSQNNNDEMGIYVKKEDDLELYNDILEEANRLLTISEEIRVSVKKVNKEIQAESEKTVSEIINSKDNFDTSFYTTKELSQKIELSSRKINSWFVSKKLMYKKDDDWHTTKQGKEIGGLEKEGQYGQFVIWPEKIIKHILD